MRLRPSGIGVTGLLVGAARSGSLNEFDSHYYCSKEAKRCSKLGRKRILSLLQTLKGLQTTREHRGSSNLT